MSGNRILKGDGTWPWTAEVDGDDIVVRNAKATWFGGASDPEDNGETASGVSTKGNPKILGCALPMDGFKAVKSTKGSPIPRLPWKMLVEVSHNGSTLSVPVIDIGPSKYTGHPLDLTVEAFRQLGGNLKQGVIIVDFRIKGGAKYL